MRPDHFRSYRRHLLSTALCVGLATGVALDAFAADPEVIKIGVVVPLTGPGAPWGLAAAEGVKIIAAETNAAGGLDVAGAKHKVEIIAYNDQFKTAETVTAVNRLINQDKAKIVMLMTSAGTMAVRDSFESNKVLGLTSSMSQKVIDKNSNYLFSMYSTPYNFLPSMIDYLKANTPATFRRVAVVNPNDELGWAQTELSTKVFKDKGYEVVEKDLFERSQRDFQSMLTKLLAAKPDVIDLGGTDPAVAGLIIRQARELGFKGQFFKGASSGPEATVAAAGAANAEGMINMLFADPTNAGFKSIAEKYKARTGNDANEVIVGYADAARVVLAAIQKAGTVSDTTKIAAAFKQTLPMTGLQGTKMVFGGNEVYGKDAQIKTVNYIGVIRDGKTVVVGEAKYD
ncbi:ABC transporter substrate-binding protein [soil metagenome]